MKEKQKQCAVEGCPNNARYKGKYVGPFTIEKRIYGTYCEFHHRSKKARQQKTIKYRFTKDAREKFPNKKCQRCGWDKAYCDRHRVIPELGYVEGNVLVLCPNCHREETVDKVVDK
jgi:hypothetical protein